MEEPDNSKLSRWKRKRDLLYLFFLMWLIIYPQDFLLIAPAAGLSYLLIKYLEKNIIV